MCVLYFFPESVWLMSVAVKVGTSGKMSITSSGSGLNVRNLQEFQLKKSLQMMKIVSILKAKKKS